MLISRINYLFVNFAAVYSLYNLSLSKYPKYEAQTLIGVWRAAATNITQNASLATYCSLLVLIVRQITDLQNGILRYCADIFIITVSAILATRFQQIAERIDKLIQRKVEAPANKNVM